jgi:hypothetical protein
MGRSDNGYEVSKSFCYYRIFSYEAHAWARRLVPRRSHFSVVWRMREQNLLVEVFSRLETKSGSNLSNFAAFRLKHTSIAKRRSRAAAKDSIQTFGRGGWTRVERADDHRERFPDTGERAWSWHRTRRS